MESPTAGVSLSEIKKQNKHVETRVRRTFGRGFDSRRLHQIFLKIWNIKFIFIVRKYLSYFF